MRLIALALFVPGLAFAEVHQPQEVAMRPLTTPGGQITVGGELGFVNLDEAYTFGPALIGQYGVNEHIEVGAGYAAPMYDSYPGAGFNAKGVARAFGGYRLRHDGGLSLAVGGSLDADLLGRDPMTGEDATDFRLSIGAAVRYAATDKLVIFTGTPIAGGPLGGQLEIGLNHEQPIKLGFPIGVGFQASPQMYAHVGTSLATLYLANGPLDMMGNESAAEFIFADHIPLAVGAFFSPSNTMDFGATLGWGDLKEADLITVMGAVRIHM